MVKFRHLQLSTNHLGLPPSVITFSEPVFVIYEKAHKNRFVKIIRIVINHEKKSFYGLAIVTLAVKIFPRTD